MSIMIGKSRTADPSELARSSKLVQAWERRVREKRAGNDLADEHWYAFLQTLARPVPPPACSTCDDTGVVECECTVNARCNAWYCQSDERRSNPMRTHTYVRPCHCDAGNTYRVSYAAATAKRDPKPAPPKSTGYGFRKAGAA